MIQAVLHGYHKVLKWALTLLMGLMVVPVLMQILSRRIDSVPRYVWTEEAARFCFVWIVMIGSMIAVREETHFYVDLLPKPKTERQRGVSRIIVHGIMLLMALVFAWYGIAFAKLGYAQTSEMSGINMLSIYISFPLAGVTWALFLLEKICDELRLIGGSEHDP